MKILNYLQAREEIKANLSEEQIERVLTISGRADEWIRKIAQVISEKGNGTSDIDVVERSGMGRAILKKIPQSEWIYLLNPTMAPLDSQVVQEQVVVNGKLYSGALSAWLRAQEIGVSFDLCSQDLTGEEASIMRILWQKQDMVVEREEIAISVWGESWSQKYSDWGIDALVHRVRNKLSGRWQIVTVKGRGYLLVRRLRPLTVPSTIMPQNELVSEIPGSIYPSDEYLKYMNDPQRTRKVYKDLFEEMRSEKIEVKSEKESKILCVNSYSYDNVDSLVEWVSANKWEGAKVYFVHYDPRAVELHSARIRELKAESYIESIYDDLRESKLKSGSFDLVINDFRLNFNQDDKQNEAMMSNTHRVLREGGIALISTVVDERYEVKKYGVDQEKAPINARNPGTFQADEHLVRRCWSVPYFKQLFKKAGFRDLVEFDVEGGKNWEPHYRRWLLRS